MDYLQECDSGTIERLGKQSGFLLSTYQAELAKDPASHGTESSRSNMIALWHTIRQIYGKAAQPKSFRPTLSFAVYAFVMVR